MWQARLVAVVVVMATAAAGMATRWRSLWRVLWATRGVAAVLLAGAAVLFATDQGRELADGVADEGWWASLCFLVAVLYWALQGWHWSRAALYARFGTRRSGWGPATLWLPRLYGLAVFALAAGSLVFAALRRADWDGSPGTLGAALGHVGRDGHLPLVLGLAALFLLFTWQRVPFTAYALRRTRRRRPAIAAGVRGLLVARRHSAARSPWCSLLGHAPLSVLFYAFSFAAFLTVFVLAAWWPVQLGRWFGSTAIIFGALATWTSAASVIVILTGRWRFPLPTVLVVTAVVADWALGDRVHPVDTVRGDAGSDYEAASEKAASGRPTLAAQTARFRDHVPAETGTVPVVFVATAGGGLRAAHWTATVLGNLADTHPGFADHLFAVSGVSGGSLGAVVFEGLLAEQQRGRLGDRRIEQEGQRILAHDFLGRVVARAVYTEPFLALNLVLPARLGFGDRANALESGWAAAWDEVRDKDFPDRSETPSNPLNSPFMRLWADVPSGGWRPILFLNATHEEQGKRIVTSNVQVTQDPFADAWDMHALLGRDLWTTTAAHNSARFSWVSPAGAIAGVDGFVSGHALDGGYFENYGALTLLEAARSALRQLHEELPGRKLQPIIVQISSDPELPERDRPVAGPGACGPRKGDYLPYDRKADSRSPWSVAQDALAPIGGVYGALGARGVLASKELAVWSECWAEREVGVKPVFVHFAMCGDVARPPLGWVMTARSRRDIHRLMPAPGREALDAACNGDALARFDRAWRGDQAGKLVATASP